MKKTCRNGSAPVAAATDSGAQLTIILHSDSDNTRHRFSVPERMSVAGFLELALTRLSEEQGAARVEALRRCYDPVLELQSPEGNRELPPDLDLKEAGVGDQAVCRIAARPRKERIMFCSYS